MKRIAAIVVGSIVALGLGMAEPAPAAEKALCLVCKVKEGTTKLEAVKAWRTHQEIRYGFCSEACAQEFDADPAAYVPVAFPWPAPELSASDLMEKPITWAAFAGQIVLLDFWATWCAPCRKSMPALQALHDRYAGRGFTVLGVSVDESKAAPRVKRFAASRKITYPIAIDSQSSPTWERFRVKAVPVAFLVDRKGQVVAQWNGAVNAKELEEKLAGLLAPVD